MSNISENGRSASDFGDLAKPTKTLTKPEEEVAAAEIAHKCDEMSTSPKVMVFTDTAGSTHSVSEMRQINMADNI